MAKQIQLYQLKRNTNDHQIGETFTRKSAKVAGIDMADLEEIESSTVDSDDQPKATGTDQGNNQDTTKS